MAVDGKYGRVTFEKEPHTPIPDDEPVFIFRAQDDLAAQVILFYGRLCAKEGSPDSHTDAIMEAYDRFVEWKEDHATKIPD